MEGADGNIDRERLVVEVHKGGNTDRLFYHVGEFNEEGVDWGGSVAYDK